MSFLDVLKKIGGVAANIEHVVVPILETVQPQWAPILNRVDDWVTRTSVAVVSAEHTVTDAKAGGLKQEAMIQDFINGMQTAQSALAIVGKAIQYDVEQYKAVVDAFAAAYNAAATFKQSWKIVDLPKT